MSFWYFFSLLCVLVCGRVSDDLSTISVLILQDATEGFDDVVGSVKTQLSQRGLSGVNGALMSFRDKPVWSLGTRVDYCQKVHTPFGDDVKELIAGYDDIIPMGGGDPYENQYGAIIAAAQSTRVKWPLKSELKLIVLITDSPPHFAEDGYNHYGLKAASGHLNETDEDGQCRNEYYPSPDQVKLALQSTSVYLAVVLAETPLALPLAVTAWQWFNQYLQQPASLVQTSTNNILDKIAAIVDLLRTSPDDDSHTTHKPDDSTKASTTPTASSQGKEASTVTSTAKETTTTKATHSSNAPSLTTRVSSSLSTSPMTTSAHNMPTTASDKQSSTRATTSPPTQASKTSSSQALATTHPITQTTTAVVTITSASKTSATTTASARTTDTEKSRAVVTASATGDTVTTALISTSGVTTVLSQPETTDGRTEPSQTSASTARETGTAPDACTEDADDNESCTDDIRAEDCLPEGCDEEACADDCYWI